jgi:DNA-binding LacI/PurR family transcriptional regulator
VRCTLRYVATEAGVSVTTVASETKARVLVAISKMQYSPKLHASELAQIREGFRRRRFPNALRTAKSNHDGCD